MKFASYKHEGKLCFGAVKASSGQVHVSKLSDTLGYDLCHWIRHDRKQELIASAENSAFQYPSTDIEFLPPIISGEKICCIGVNYAKRNAEYKDGSELPKYPSLFIRYLDSFTGHETPIIRPPESDKFDYEGEIVIVIGKAGRRIPRTEAHNHIAGLTLMNEGTIRDWVRHAKFNVTQGKNFEKSGSIGPWMVLTDERLNYDNLDLQTRVNGEIRQDDNSSNLMFPFDYIISYLSTFMTLKPGDMISTGTPNGAGARFDPPIYLKPDDIVEVESSLIGTLRNKVEDEKLD